MAQLWPSPRQLCERPDVFLINQYRLPLDKVIHMGRRIRQDAGLPSTTSIVIMAEGYGEDMEGG